MDQPKSNSRRTLIRCRWHCRRAERCRIPGDRAQSIRRIRLGHLTPRTGFLGQVGEYAVTGVRLAVEEINAAGGVLGRKIEMIAEDSVNPATAVTKAKKLVERDKVVGTDRRDQLGFGARDRRAGTALQDPVFQHRRNSDALRGRTANATRSTSKAATPCTPRPSAHGEVQKNLIKGARWAFLTADYAFGHDLYRVSSRFLEQNGGIILSNDFVPTNTAGLQRLHSQDPPAQARLHLPQSGRRGPDHVPEAVQGIRPAVSACRRRDGHCAVLGTGLDALSGHWQSLWYHGLNIPAARAFTERFSKKYGQPPENQAWGDYIGVRIVVQTVAETKGTDASRMVQHLEKGAEFDLLKARKGKFRDWDHQLLQEMYVVNVKDKSKSKDQWDIFDIVETVPGAKESLELIQPTTAGKPLQVPAGGVSPELAEFVFRSCFFSSRSPTACWSGRTTSYCRWDSR